MIQSLELYERTTLEMEQDHEQGHQWASLLHKMCSLSIQSIERTAPKTITSLQNDTLMEISSLLLKAETQRVHLIRQDIFMQMEGRSRKGIVQEECRDSLKFVDMGGMCVAYLEWW